MQNYPGHCKSCARHLVGMGYRWRPPRRLARAKWRQQRLRWESGLMPDGKVPTWNGRWHFCKWCNKSHDQERIIARRLGLALPEFDC